MSDTSTEQVTEDRAEQPSGTARSPFWDTVLVTFLSFVLALVIGLLSGRIPQEIADLDLDDLFGKLHLAEHLSPNRHFGIYSLVEKMKTQAMEAGEPAKAQKVQNVTRGLMVRFRTMRTVPLWSSTGAWHGGPSRVSPGAHHGQSGRGGTGAGPGAGGPGRGGR